jgi:universal stress protein A
MKRPRPILHATDFSKASRPAWRYALGLAKENAAPLLIVHVLVPPILGEGEVFPRIYEELIVQMRSEATRKLAALLRESKKARVPAAGFLRRGVPHVEIVRAARGRRAQLIVIGTHGRTRLVRLLLGSVASRVIGTGPCPVVTVPSRSSH